MKYKMVFKLICECVLKAGTNEPYDMVKVIVNEPFDSESESHTVDKLFEEAEASSASTSLLIFFTRWNSEVNREHTFFV